MNQHNAKPADITTYLPLVKRIAARIMSRLPTHIEFDDLIGYGVVGLTEALNTFDSNKNVKFSTYAFYRIKGSILDGLRAIDWLPRPARQKIRKLEVVSDTLKAQLGRDPSESELAEHLGVPIDEVSTVLVDAQQARMVSLEERLQNTVSATQDDVVEDELLKIMTDAINNLDEKERMVVSLYYYEELNLKEIGCVIGVSESRVSQILSKALVTLRDKTECIRSEF